MPFLFSWYSDPKSSIPWNNNLFPMVCVKEFFHPFSSLFTLMIQLLTRLQSQGVGCRWCHYFVGAVGYADDIALLAPSSSALKIMLRICCRFADNHIFCSMLLPGCRTFHHHPFCLMAKFSHYPIMLLIQVKVCGLIYLIVMIMLKLYP